MFGLGHEYQSEKKQGPTLEQIRYYLPHSAQLHSYIWLRHKKNLGLQILRGGCPEKAIPAFYLNIVTSKIEEVRNIDRATFKIIHVTIHPYLHRSKYTLV